jgi:PPK2 family polyphosphate:nucleotide phosphotransferase
MLPKDIIKEFLVPVGKKVRLKDYDPGWAQSKAVKELGKDGAKAEALKILQEDREELAKAHDILYASDTYAVLVILQGMDASGKDGIIKHVMSGLNPQGCQVTSFKKPSVEELDHDFLWRCAKALPARGRIGIFNRSYYEEVLVVRIHPEFLDAQHLPPGKRGKSFWEDRYDSINAFERHLVRNGTVILKFFLHISKKEQKRRLLERLGLPAKHWKFSGPDLVERGFWDEYQDAYESALAATSTAEAPWHVIPADHKWVARTVVADILTRTICGLDLQYPEVTPAQKEAIRNAKQQLESE